MTCVSSVTYSVLLNRRPAGLITPSRGLRKRDLLSPYLFLLCAEGISSLLLKAEREESISGVLVSVKGYCLSHLFFANDSLLFCRANFMEWVRIHQLLKLYESASGQKLNVDKTSIFFSKNTKREFKEHIRFLVGTSATTSVQVSNQFQNFLQVYATCILMIAHHYRDSQMYRTRKDYVRNSLVFECTFTALSILVRHAKEQVEGFAQASEQ
jgi:hypothetical protein